jgi:hypothetical protein
MFVSGIKSEEAFAGGMYEKNNAIENIEANNFLCI